MFRTMLLKDNRASNSRTEHSSIQKGSVQCTLGAGNIDYLLSAVWYSSSFETSERDDFIHLPCSAIYGYLSVFKLIIKPVVVLLEDQRSEASCERNIKANVPLFELVYYTFPLYTIKIHAKIPV